MYPTDGLKGQQHIAQGNALGLGGTCYRPEGRDIYTEFIEPTLNLNSFLYKSDFFA